MLIGDLKDTLILWRMSYGRITVTRSSKWSVLWNECFVEYQLSILSFIFHSIYSWVQNQLIGSRQTHRYIHRSRQIMAGWCADKSWWMDSFKSNRIWIPIEYVGKCDQYNTLAWYLIRTGESIYFDGDHPQHLVASFGGIRSSNFIRIILKGWNICFKFHLQYCFNSLRYLHQSTSIFALINLNSFDEESPHHWVDRSIENQKIAYSSQYRSRLTQNCKPNLQQAFQPFKTMQQWYDFPTNSWNTKFWSVNLLSLNELTLCTIIFNVCISVE